MDVALKRYQKDFDYSYAFGVFPTLELLQHRGEHALRVLLHSKGRDSLGAAKIEALCAQARIPLEVNDRAIERISPKENHYALGVFEKYAPPLAPAGDHVVLVSPGDMGNLGTILRTMLGFDVASLALVRPAADIFDPRVVRASMGALFQVSCQYYAEFDEYRAAFAAQHVYAFMTRAPQPLGQVSFRGPFALVFGNESSGLEDAYQSAGTAVAIAHSRKIDSLNLPTAVGIALYAARQSRH